MRNIAKLLILVIILGGTACSREVSSNKIITVTIEPQKYFARQLVDSLFDVEVMVPAGTSPETYDPSPVQMAKLAESVAYFQIGHIGFEEVWMDRIVSNNPELQVFDNSKGMTLIGSDEEENDESEHNHSHSDKHGHQHFGVDPHTWSSPREAKIIANNMYEALIKLDPENKTTYQANLNKLQEQIRQTDSIVSGLIAGITNKSFIIYHPALSYFADYYGLKQICIETGGKEPSPGQLKTLVETARAENVKAIFIQQEFDRKNAELISRETGCNLVVINPLSYFWNEELIRIAKALSE